MTSQQRDMAFDNFCENNAHILFALWLSIEHESNLKTFSWEIFNRYPQFQGGQKISPWVIRQLKLKGNY